MTYKNISIIGIIIVTFFLFGCTENNKISSRQALNDINFNIPVGLYIPKWPYNTCEASVSFISSELSENWQYYNPENTYHCNYGMGSPDYINKFNYASTCLSKGNPGDNINIRYCSIKSKRQITSKEGIIGQFETVNINFTFDIRDLKNHTSYIDKGKQTCMAYSTSSDGTKTCGISSYTSTKNIFIEQIDSMTAKITITTDKNEFLVPEDINIVSIIYNNKDLLK